MAHRALARVVELNPRHAVAWAKLAKLQLESGHFTASEGSLANAINTQQGGAVAQNLIGTVFRLAGNVGEARRWYRRATEQFAGHAGFVTDLANAELYLGNLDAAERLFERALGIEPANAQLHWRLSGVRRARDRSHIGTLRSLESRATSDIDAAYLAYAIGKEAEDLEDWPLAIEAFRRGAAARRRTVDYDEARDEAVFAAAADVFTPAWLRRSAGSDREGGPLFIVGEPRTGTTLLDTLLSRHPSIATAGELQHLGFALRRAASFDEPRTLSADLIAAAGEVSADAVASAYRRSTSALRGDAAWLTDKLPYNYVLLPLILAAFPGAKILHLVRDPMDACFAAFKQLFRAAYFYSYDLEEQGRHYLRYLSLMATWRERFPGRFLDVRYEDLVTDPHATLVNVFEYLDLELDSTVLSGAASDGAVTTASAVQIREAPHSASVGRWLHYEAELLPLRRILEPGRAEPA